MPVLVKNRKARFNYELLEEFEAGIVLTGSEVKSIITGQANIAEGYIKIENGEVWLTNTHISEYKNAGFTGHEPARPRKLLLKKREIRRLEGKVQQKGLTLVPLSMYTRNKKIKVCIALARGKKVYDKRETIKRREADHEAARAMANAR